MPPEDKVESTMIKYIHGSYAEDYVSWVDRLDDHLSSESKALVMAGASLTRHHCWVNKQFV